LGTGAGQDGATPVFTYTEAGTYTAVVTAENECGEGSASTGVVVEPRFVCTDVMGVELVQLSMGTPYTDTLVRFSADIVPDDASKPYDLEVLWGDSLGITDSSSDDPLTLEHTYDATGTYQVDIYVSNCDMGPGDAVSDTLQLTVYEQGVCVGLAAVAISGESSGVPGVYTFTTDYDPPDASWPITYTWENGDAAGTSIRFLDVGTHTLGVTATNCAGTEVTGAHTIVISPALGFYIYLPVVLKAP
jgi:PKD repeat protein